MGDAYGQKWLLVVNDNNFPFSTGRNPLRPDYNDHATLAGPTFAEWLDAGHTS